MKYDELISELRSEICKNNCLYCVYMKTGCTPKRCERAAEAIEELQKPKWIPVSERLPDVHKNVLCCGSKGGQFVGWVSNHVSDGKALAFVHGGYGRLITHWMPLPEPPKEETDG